MKKTEQVNDQQPPLDTLSLREGAQALVAAQITAAEAVAQCTDVLANAVPALTNTLATGGTLFYAAAGSSGLMSAADAMELGGTFGIPDSRVRIVMAGGIPQSARMPGDVEDDVAPLTGALNDISAADCLIAVSASGDTPFAVHAAMLAKQAGATVIALANNANASLFEWADHPVLLDTPPEALAGSTRLGAGTAQKVALNTLSTLTGVALGHVYRGRMVNLHADNTKLRGRARDIIQDITWVDHDTAERALSNSHGDVKLACVIASGAQSLDAARNALRAEDGHIERAIARLSLTPELRTNRR